MGLNRGDNIIIQIVDEGIYAKHEDLYKNIDIKHSYDGLKASSISKPLSIHNHGTKIAGVIAARAFNGKGVRGIIPFAKIASSDWLLHGTYDILDKIWYSGYGANDIAVSNNSWGFDFNTDTIFEEYMQKGSNELRDGKGRLYVFPSGNRRIDNGNANLEYLLNNRFAIVVSSINYNNKITSYSSKGSNILTCAYSGESKDTTPTIATTTIPYTSSNSGSNQTTWHNDISRSYTYDFDGTSASAPMVSASLGLVLEACPSLTWRDIRYLIATTSKKIDITNSSWVTNSAGLSHSIDYGFGLINPSAMIDRCQNNYQNLPKVKKIEINREILMPISDDNRVNSFELNIIRNIKIEWVELIININHQYASDIKIDLISPSNTKTNLIDINNISGNTYKYSTTANWMNGGFRFSSAAFIEENSKGRWRIDVYDTVKGDKGNIKGATLIIYGH
jgi:subtilisin-like proprotein convertase family protein